ncbi:hypothetical protein [Bartonella sp. HY406]|uniref:hypothetical protein n=1 Tax=Bartonella sp. HY406 TaxID=2979331 RepID=UPI0021C8B554|nr:hypothetical protein [Bartonella sp. HY406]UXN03118.1 hypothetical protein N6B01_11730 [Bartonella sp. HY406]
MSLSIYLTSEWSFDEIAPYSKAIGEAMKKLEQRFPDDISIANLARNIAEGVEQLWLILDEKKEFVAFVTSQKEVTETGRKRLLLLELAGEGGPFIADLIETIEVWARNNGFDEICPIGRLGWRKALAKHGYAAKFVRYYKEL